MRGVRGGEGRDEVWRRGVVEAGAEREEAGADGGEVGFRGGGGGVFFVVLVAVVFGVRRGGVRAVLVVSPEVA